MSKNYTEKEAAAKYGMSVHWYRRKRWSGGGPEYMKMDSSQGGRVLYSKAALDKYFKSKNQKSTSTTGKK